MSDIELSPKSARTEKIVIEFKSAVRAHGAAFFALVHHDKDGHVNCVWVGLSREMAQIVAQAWGVPVVDKTEAPK